MRLLVDKAILTNKLTKPFRVWLGPNHPFRTVRRLQYLDYPLGERTLDEVLWMVPNDLDEWPGQLRRINDRVRWSATNPEELHHAAATFCVFEACEALIYHMHQLFPEADRIGRRNMPEARRERIVEVVAQAVAEARQWK